jgi:hypothetical protein
MRGLVFAQSVNRPDRHDATGAFLPGAEQFTRLHKLDRPVLLDGKHDRENFMDTIGAAADLDVIAYFGHGTRASLPSAGIHWSDLNTLAPRIKKAAAPTCQVILYACSTAGVGYFADTLARKMDNLLTVWGHTCEGHSFTNPYVQYFPFLSSPYLIAPQGPLWSKWQALIKSKSDIWARYPFMSQGDLEEEVASSVARPFVHKRHKRAA